ncbi:MAG: hypothetical protein SVV80_03750 [Planctomycetota bacterium]|nr:hypothetical protein [Planctomycetota bacterium]
MVVDFGSFLVVYILSDCAHWKGGKAHPGKSKVSKEKKGGYGFLSTGMKGSVFWRMRMCTALPAVVPPGISGQARKEVNRKEKRRHKR